MSDIKTFLIDDNRISGITDEITMAVKKGPSSSVIQSYKQVSNSSSSCLFNVSVPSENTLVNRNLRINTTLQMRVVFKDTVPAVIVNVIPAAFPLNSGISSASVTMNNTKLSVQTEDIMPTLLKQYQQEFLSKHVSTTPVYVDKYWGSLSDAGVDERPSSYFSGVIYSEKDSNVAARADCDFELILYDQAGAKVDSVNGLSTIPAGSVAGFYADIKIKVSEPILGLPTFELKDHEAAFMGVNNIELTLQFNDCKHVLYFNAATEALIDSRGPGTLKDNASSTFLDDAAKLTVNYLTLHPSDYSKMMPKNVIPYNEFINYKSTQSITLATASTTFISNQVQLRQVPDKIYISVSPTYSNLPTTASNHLCFPLSKLGITFNNRANLLSEMDSYDLYMMSKRNGSNQSYNEFRGVVRNYNGAQYLSLGSVIVIDPRDLSLDDYLASGSIGQFSLQVQAEVSKFFATTVFGTVTELPCQMNIICSYGGVLVTQQGSSASMSGLLTKNLVLETKENGNSIGDSEEVTELSAGNVGRSLTSLANVLNKKGRKVAKKNLDKLSSKLDGGYGMSAGSYQVSGGAKGSRLSKYM